jgi:hypothetical protein
MKGFKNVIMMLLMVGVFFIHLNNGTVVKAKSVYIGKNYVTGYTIDTHRKDFGRIGAKRIIVPREQVLYIEEKDE